MHRSYAYANLYWNRTLVPQRVHSTFQVESVRFLYFAFEASVTHPLRQFFDHKWLCHGYGQEGRFL